MSTANTSIEPSSKLSEKRQRSAAAAHQATSSSSSQPLQPSQQQAESHHYESYEEPIRDASNDTNKSRQRRQRGGRGHRRSSSQPLSPLPHPFSTNSTLNSRATHSEPPQPHQQEQEQQPPPSPSFPDRIAASALAGTLELLKLAGGVTLSTTGKLVAPPLHVTRTLVIPSLLAATVDYISDKTPTRVKDWYRILATSVHRVWTVLKNTAAGILFRQRLLNVGIDLVNCLSSDASRQVLVDGMACSVKLAEALHTPQVQALLEQVAITACRVGQAAASGTSQQLVHDLAATIWSGCALVADPNTTVALAEVTAYLVHALEMEHAHVYDIVEDNNKAKAQAERRYRRNQQQTAMTQPFLVTDPDATVEQVILSSLGRRDGGAALYDNENEMELDNDNDDEEEGGKERPCSNKDDNDSVPSNVVVDHGDDDDGCDDGDDHDSQNQWETSSIRQLLTQEGEEGGSNKKDPKESDDQEWHERAGKQVNVDFLRERIEERATRIQQHERRVTETTTSSKPSGVTPVAVDGGGGNNMDEGEDVEELGVVVTVGEEDDDYDKQKTRQPKPTQSSKRQNIRLEASSDDFEVARESKEEGEKGAEWPQAAHVNPLEGETPVQHFNRILDECLRQKRDDSMKWVVAKAEDSVVYEKGSKKERARIHKSAFGKEGEHETIKQRLAAFRAAVKADLEEDREEQRRRMEKAIKTYGPMVYVALGALVLFVLMWIGFGCYGMYVYFNPVVEKVKSATSTPVRQFAPSSGDEVVIRVVREVVHVDKDGNVLDSTADHSGEDVLPEEGINKIAQSIIDALPDKWTMSRKKA